MSTHLAIAKTYKLFINGLFPRSESGRSLVVHGRARRSATGKSGRSSKSAIVGGRPVLGHVCWASRKDLRDAVEAARAASAKWGESTAYLRGQILYRLAEMLEGKRDELADLLANVESTGPDDRGTKARSRARGTTANPAQELDAAIDRLVAFAGWTDKVMQVLGSANPVAGPYYNFTIPQPTGVTVAIAPDTPPLLGLVTAIAPPLAAGNTVVAIASDTNPLPAAVLAEAAATADVPPGALNILTGKRDELLPHIAGHRDVAAVLAINPAPAAAKLLRAGSAENLKRVRIEHLSDADMLDPARSEHPWRIEPFMDMKTIWHPSAP